MNYKVIKKPWGQEELLEKNESYMVKRLTMLAGHQCSYQYHEKKRETFIVLTGPLTVVFEDGDKEFKAGDSMTIEPGVKHRMKAVNTDAVYLECSTPEMEDVVRLEDDYKRT